jgi:hypothetical protein
MKLEYLDDLTDGGKFSYVVSKNLIRLYDFDQVQSKELVELIHMVVIDSGDELDISALSFVQPVNCKLLFRVADFDEGVLRTFQADKFVCELTKQSFCNLIEKMIKVSTGHSWLCDTSKDDIDLLFSSGGTW